MCTHYRRSIMQTFFENNYQSYRATISFPGREIFHHLHLRINATVYVTYVFNFIHRPIYPIDFVPYILVLRYIPSSLRVTLPVYYLLKFALYVFIVKLQIEENGELLFLRFTMQIVIIRGYCERYNDYTSTTIGRNISRASAEERFVSW